MKATIEVKSRQEAELIKAGLADATVRAFVQVVGAIAPLSPSGQRRVLTFLSDRQQEEEERHAGR